jgi:Mn2+/Fe2+ NRAMP family transporter
MFTRRPDLMKTLVNHWSTTFIGGSVAALIVILNVYLIYTTFWGT